MKTSRVQPGHDVFYMGAWYGPGVRLIVDEGATVEAFVTYNGHRGACIGKYSYLKVNTASPPAGLRGDGEG